MGIGSYSLSLLYFYSISIYPDQPTLFNSCHMVPGGRYGTLENVSGPCEPK